MPIRISNIYGIDIINLVLYLCAFFNYFTLRNKILNMYLYLTYFIYKYIYLRKELYNIIVFTRTILSKKQT